MGNQKWKNIFLICAIIFLIIEIITFVVTPFFFDLYLLISGSIQADYLDGSILNKVLNSWEMKGFFFRLIIYCFYKGSSLFYSVGSIEFETLFRTLYAIYIYILSLISAKLICIKRNIVNILILSVIISSLFFMNSEWIHMQGETNAVLFMILALSLTYNAIKTNIKTFAKLFIAGVLLGLLFGLKILLAAYLVVFLLGIYLIFDDINEKLQKRELLTIIGGFLFSIISQILIICIYNPNHFQDILDISVFQHTLLKQEINIITDIWSYFSEFISAFLAYSYRIQFLLFGFAAFIYSLFKYGVKRKPLNFIFMVLIWCIPAILVIVSNRFFCYHYFPFVFSSVISVIILLRDIENINYNYIYKASLFIVPVIILCTTILQSVNDLIFNIHILEISYTLYILLTIFLILAAIFQKIRNKNIFYIFILLALGFNIFYYLNYESLFSENMKIWQKTEEELREVNIWTPENNDEILYLDAGIGSYLIKNKSYLKYYFALPFQRINENSEESSLKSYKEAYDKILFYDGEYIILWGDWFFFDEGGRENNTKIKTKINNEYEQVENICFKFVLPDRIPIIYKQTDDSIATFYLYRKKK